MDFMMRLSENMVMLIHGSTAQKSSTILVLELLLRVRFSVFTVVYHQILRLLIKLDLLKEEWKSHMKDLSVISCGLTLKKLKLGPCLQEEQDGYSDQKLLLSSITSMILSLLLEHINWLWMASNIGLRIKPS